jgi:hypothetical protein
MDSPGASHVLFVHCWSGEHGGKNAMRPPLISYVPPCNDHIYFLFCHFCHYFHRLTPLGYGGLLQVCLRALLDWWFGQILLDSIPIKDREQGGMRSGSSQWVTSFHTVTLLRDRYGYSSAWHWRQDRTPIMAITARNQKRKKPPRWFFYYL